jgi:hypothetical protein
MPAAPAAENNNASKNFSKQLYFRILHENKNEIQNVALVV